MKNSIVFLIMIVLVSCKCKEDAIVHDFIDGVPDARFAGTWYNNGKSATYSFSSIDNTGSYAAFSRPTSSAPAVAYKFFWRKSSVNGKFEQKLDFGDKVWSDFQLVFVDDKNIKIGNETYSK